MIFFWIFVIGVILLVGAVIGGYNGLVQSRNQVHNAWSQVDVQLKRRHDLIPNLIESVKGYMVHERETLEAVTRSRSCAMDAKEMPEKLEAEAALGKALGRFYAVMENYPELKADQNFLLLQEELTATENRIAFARQAYNDQVNFLNDKVQMFPTNLMASLFGFTSATYFHVASEERDVPPVSFS